MRLVTLVGITLFALATALAPASAEEPPPEEPKRPWTDTAEFSWINTTGNSRTSNVALANKYGYNWEQADLTVDAAALRAESEGETTAEAYSLAGKYRRNVTERFLWYGLTGWSRNEFAGFTDRYTGGAGVGYRFLKPEPHSLVGELGLNYTDEERVEPNPDDSWTEARAFLGYAYTISPTAKLEAELEAFENLEESTDWRGRALTSLTASLTNKLALKASYRVIYDHEPVPGFGKTDTISSASLVVNF